MHPEGQNDVNAPASEAASNRNSETRSRRLLVGIVSSVATRSLTALSPLLLIPVTLPALGNAQFGVWMTVVAVTGMIAWADLGLGSGLLTKLSGSIASDDKSKSRQYVSSAYGVVGLIAIVLLLFLWVFGRSLNWSDMLGASPGPSSENASSISIICLSLYAANIPVSLIHRVQFAAQMVTRSNLWQGAGGVASLLLAIGAVQTGQSDLTIVAAASSGPLLMNILNTIDIFTRVLPHLRPSPRFFQAQRARTLVALGLKFFILSIVTSVALSSDNLIVAHSLGANSVTELAVPARVLGAMGLLITLVNLPLWPANAEAIARGDTAWVQRTTRRMMIGSALVVGISGGIFVIFGGHLLGILSNSQVNSSTPLLASLCLWWLFIAVSSPMTMAQNAAGDLRTQLVGWFCFLALSLPIKLLVANALGLAWMVFFGGLVYAATVWPAVYFGYRRVLRQQRNRASTGTVIRIDHHE